MLLRWGLFDSLGLGLRRLKLLEGRILSFFLPGRSPYFYLKERGWKARGQQRHACWCVALDLWCWNISCSTRSSFACLPKHGSARAQMGLGIFLGVFSFEKLLLWKKLYNSVTAPLHFSCASFSLKQSSSTRKLKITRVKDHRK